MTYDLNELQALLAKMTPGERYHNRISRCVAVRLENGFVAVANSPCPRSPYESVRHKTWSNEADGIVALVNAARGGLIADHLALQARVAELEAEVTRLRADLNLERTGGFALSSSRLAEIERAALGDRP